MKTWKEKQLAYLEFCFKKAAEAWKEEHDDRRLFSNTYYMLHEAINSLNDEPHVCVRVAMNRYMDSHIETMFEIRERFEEMGIYVK